MTWGLYSSFSRALVLTPFHLSLSESLFMLLAHLVPALSSTPKDQLPCDMLQFILDPFIKVAFEVSLRGLFLRAYFTCRVFSGRLFAMLLIFFSQGRLRPLVNCLLSVLISHKKTPRIEAPTQGSKYVQLIWGGLSVHTTASSFRKISVPQLQSLG